MIDNKKRFSLPLVDLNIRQSCVYISLLFICYLLFQQGDLAHTTISSYAFLDGHFFDFYDYNKGLLYGNDYLPLIYVIFSIWNIPLYISGFTTPSSLYPSVLPIEIAWAKLLLVIFFAISIWLINKIELSILNNRHQVRQQAAYYFATGPISIFAVFIFSQYDIISVCFTLAGFYYYLKKDFVRFSLFFSIAISFKYFALVIYFPLILMIEKRFLHIAKYMLIGILFTLLQVLIYSGSRVFMSEIFTLASGKASGAFSSGLSLSNPVIYTAILYISCCIYLYCKEFKSDNEINKSAVFVPIFSYGLMFSSVVWHPQWIIIVMPFFALAYSYVSNKKLLLFADLVGMLSFVWLCVNYWPRNVDITMMGGGILRAFIPPSPLIMSDIMLPGFLPIMRPLFYAYLFSPVILILYESIFKKYIHTNEVNKNYFNIRLVLGVSFFLAPCLILPFIPIQVALKISHEASLNIQHRSVLVVSGEVPVGEIIGKEFVVQTFFSTMNGLSAISVSLATCARINHCKIALRLEDSEGLSLVEKVVESASLADNEYYNFTFSPILDSKNKKYRFIIEGLDCHAGNAITAWASRSNVYLQGEMMVAKTANSGDLVMTIFYDPKIR